LLVIDAAAEQQACSGAEDPSTGSVVHKLSEFDSGRSCRREENSSSQAIGRRRANGVMECWSIGFHHSNTPLLQPPVRWRKETVEEIARSASLRWQLPVLKQPVFIGRAPATRRRVRRRT
jgi:hypothetical protein